MGIHIRQVCLVAHRLQPAIHELAEVLGIESCYVDPGVGRFGLENNLLAIGTNFLEVVAPVEENTAAGRFLTKRRGDGGYILVCQVDGEDDQSHCRKNAAALGIRVAYESNRGAYHLMQLHPADLKNTMWEIDWDERSEIDGVWEPAGGVGWRDHVKADVTVSLSGVELQSEDPQTTAQQWGKIAGLEAEQITGGWRSLLGNGELRFVQDTDGRGPGLSGVDLQVCDKQAIMTAAGAIDAILDDNCIELCGTRFYLNEISD